jgi:hypothetical protein
MRILPISMVALILAAPFCASSIALGAPINTLAARWYATGRLQRTTQRDITAVKAVLNGGTNSVTAGPPTPTEQYGTAIQKDLWVYFNDINERDCYFEAMTNSGQWTPAQAANGIAAGYPSSVAPTFKGYELGVTGSDMQGNKTVTAYIYGANNSPAAATGGTIEMKKVASGAWEIWINGARALTPPLRCATAAYVPYVPVNASASDLGIESNDTGNTFVSGTTADASVKTVFGSPNYVPWANVNTNSANPGPNWATSYNSTTGRLTYTR